MHLSHIPQYTIQNRNVKKMCTFLFWMVYCGIWGRCVVRLVILVSYYPRGVTPGRVTLKDMGKYDMYQTAIKAIEPAPHAYNIESTAGVYNVCYSAKSRIWVQTQGDLACLVVWARHLRGIGFHDGAMTWKRFPYYWPRHRRIPLTKY